MNIFKCILYKLCPCIRPISPPPIIMVLIDEEDEEF